MENNPTNLEFPRKLQGIQIPTYLGFFFFFLYKRNLSICQIIHIELSFSCLSPPVSISLSLLPFLIVCIRPIIQGIRVSSYKVSHVAPILRSQHVDATCILSLHYHFTLSPSKLKQLSNKYVIYIRCMEIVSKLVECQIFY